MVTPTVELAEYYANVGSPVYVYAFNHHKLPDPATYQARRKTVCTTCTVTCLSGGYNCDSTEIRLQFDRATTIRRLTSRPGSCAAA